MCWVTNKMPVKLIAEFDIPVKKILYRINESLHSPCFRRTKWNVGKIKNCTLAKPIISQYNDFNWEIYKGFHSCKELYKRNKCWYCGDDLVLKFSAYDVICDCVIPAGAEYYINENGLYVSNRLIFCAIC